MYNIAQQMVQSDTYLKDDASLATAGMATKGSPGAYPPPPFNSAIFSDPAFAMSVQKATAAALSAALPPLSHLTRGSPPNAVLLSEFGDGEHKPEEDDYYSEDEADCKFEDEDLKLFDFHPHPAHPAAVPFPPTVPGTSSDAVAQVVLSYGEHNARAAIQPTRVGSESNAAAVEAPKQADVENPADHKQRKHNEGTDGPAGSVGAVPNAACGVEARSAGTAPVSAPEKDGRLATAGVEATQRPALTVNAMLAARKENPSVNPPPSSRAQGKLPMPYAPTTAPSTTSPQPRTARAASKAPMPVHNYVHSHHHPSPPSSNASAPNKSRSTVASSSNKNPQNNNKIWSTSSTEERERIKEFWLGLGEDERRNLVKIEKDTVLKKMKEQQKHSCSCAVCGRKRSVPIFQRI